MARNLKTGWVIVATSGPTVDGRKIEKEWLQDMAATYKENVYSAKIWPDHKRYFGAQGKVVDLKIEPATDEALKGEIHLMAILAPTDDLVYANRRGNYTHSSIEVLKNFRGTGKFYLGGMAATDEPASVGTSELNFSTDKDTFWIAGPEVDFSPVDSVSDEEKSLIFKISKLFNKDKGESQDIPMDKEQFEKFSNTQNKTNDLLEKLIGNFAALVPSKTDDDGKEKPTGGKGKGDGENEFVSKKDHTELLEKFTDLATKLDTALKTQLPGTQFTENLGDVEPEL